MSQAVGNDDELKHKLEDTLAALTGKTANPEEDDEEDDDETDVPCNCSSGINLSDVFTEDVIAGMVVGFVAGAAVVGGGVLLHKLLK